MDDPLQSKAWGMFDVHVCLEGNPWQVEAFAVFQQQQRDETCSAHVGLMTASGERLPFAAWVSHRDSKGKRGLSRHSWHQEVHNQLEDSGKEDSLWEKHGKATADWSVRGLNHSQALISRCILPPGSAEPHGGCKSAAGGLGIGLWFARKKLRC